MIKLCFWARCHNCCDSPGPLDNNGFRLVSVVALACVVRRATANQVRYWQRDWGYPSN